MNDEMKKYIDELKEEHKRYTETNHKRLCEIEKTLERIEKRNRRGSNYDRRIGSMFDDGW